MTTNRSRTSSILICALGIAFLTIIFTSLLQRIINPSLTINRTLPMGAPSQMSAMQNSEMTTIGVLMQKAAQNPDDEEVLLELVENLLGAGQWQAAENFAQKALTLKSPQNKPKLTYLLALAHHNKGEHAQAAELLEGLLSENENPSARYSLGILYIHYLNEPEKGIAQLQKGLEIKDISPALARAMQEELDKWKDKKN